MLDYIRSNAQSFGVKVAFAIIILVFMFWGVGSLTDGGSSNVVAKVNGEAITAQQFEQAYQRAAEYAMRNDPSLTVRPWCSRSWAVRCSTSSSAPS